MKGLNSREIREIHRKLNEQFGITAELNYLFFANNEDKIYLINKDFLKVALNRFRVNSFGLYFGKIEKNGIRLNISGSQLIGDKIKNNLFETDKKEEWLNGNNLECSKDMNDWVVVKNGKDYLGCGYCKNGILMNFIPKTRK